MPGTDAPCDDRSVAAGVRRVISRSTGRLVPANRHAIALAFALACGSPAVARAQVCVPNSITDWMVTAFAEDPGTAAVRPADCATVQQNPPDFSWPDVTGSSYTLNLTFPDGHVESRTAAQSWLDWNGTLPAGSYRWTVSQNGRLGNPRRFTVGTDAVRFVVPDLATLVRQLSQKPHPRGLPDAVTLAAMARQRAGVALPTLRSQVRRNLNGTLPGTGLQGAGYAYGNKALASLMAYVYDGADTYKRDARARVLNLASWDPRGPTAGSDVESVFVAWVVTLGYDWLGPALDVADRTLIRAMLRTRIGDLYGWVAGRNGWPRNASHVPPPLWHHPRDSHRANAAMMVAAMSTLLVGDLPEAQTWLQSLLPFVLNALSPWGGEDGAYANGTAYSMWDIGSQLSAWYALRWATCGSPKTCVDLAQKAWVRNYGEFLAYFVPPTYAADLAAHQARAADPGTPIGLFGDGFADPQLFEERSRFAKGYANFAPSALGCWYATSLVGEDYTRIEYLMSPPSSCASPSALPSGTPNSLYLPSTGWMAMHSDLSDLNRASVYFKSSPAPFGAYNHQSADQNAFVINAGGERLAIESGYYDDYNTGHWQYWVKRTKSKNAITFDGGQGQHAFENVRYDPSDAPQYSSIRYGSIIQQRSAADYDIVTGDATDAYNNVLRGSGPLTRAVRSLVYLRPNTILVYDSLASGTAHKWEWNIHSLSPIAVISRSRIRIARGARSLCVDTLAGPGGNFAPLSSPDYSSWGTTNGVSAAPSVAAPLEYHGMFASATASASAEIIVLIRVNAACNDAPPAATERNGVWNVNVAGKTVSFDSATGRAAVD